MITNHNDSNPPRIYKAGRDIRLNLTTSCQRGCSFCHLEGHKSDAEIGTLNPALISWKEKRERPLIERLNNALKLEDIEFVIAIARKVGLTRIHLTGGEPTLHPNLLQIIQQLSKAGFSVGITTHGEMSTSRIETLLRSGISSITFSLHALTTEQYLATDLVAQEIERNYSKEKACSYARMNLMNKQKNIIQALSVQNKNNITVNVNSVVLDKETTSQIIHWCNCIGVPIRLQRDLNNKERSAMIIKEIIEHFNAKSVQEDLAVGDSSGSGIHYVYQTGSFKVKKFGEVYIPSMCSRCPLKGTEKCRERFYGIRIEHGRVVTCIDIDVPSITSFSFEEFLTSANGVPYDIIESYERAKVWEESNAYTS